MDHIKPATLPLPAKSAEPSCGVVVTDSAPASPFAGRGLVDYGDRLRIGIVVPSGNVIAEPEISAMLPSGVAAYFTRLPLRGSSPDELMGMLEGLDEATQLLADMQPDLLVFHCTAVTTYDSAIGNAIRDRMTALSGVPAMSTSDALVAALKALRIRKVVLLSPYLPNPHDREIEFLTEHGFHVVADAALGINTNRDMAAVDPAELYDFVARNALSTADAYFLSCTALRSADIIEPLEAFLGKPVLTSNQVMVWQALSLGGISDQVSGFGRLFQTAGRGGQTDALIRP